MYTAHKLTPEYEEKVFKRAQRIGWTLFVIGMVIVAVLYIMSWSVKPVRASEKPKPNYKVTRLSIQEVGVSCVNGQVPEAKMVGHTIIIGCDAE